MVKVRRINVSQIDGGYSDDSDKRPDGEMALYDNDSGGYDFVIHDGVTGTGLNRVFGKGVFYGHNADSGDGNGYDTIKLIPDIPLWQQGSHQYLVVDPTSPNHIHIRPGGDQDQSAVDLYIGAEQTFVRVSDSSDNVTIQTSFTAEGITSYAWTFNNSGDLSVPNYIRFRDGSFIGDEGGAFPPMFRIDAAAGQGIALTSDIGEGNGNFSWYFGANGNLSTPGDIFVNSAKIAVTPTVTPAGTIIQVPLNAAGDTIDYTGGASVIEVPTNSDTDLVEAGWIITFNGGTQRTVSNKIMAGGYTSIYFNDANPGGTLYPLTIQSADYIDAVTGKVDLLPDSANTSIKLSVDAVGKTTFPTGAAIETVGMGWSGLTANGAISFVARSGEGNDSGITVFAGENATVGIYANDATNQNYSNWLFSANGSLTFSDGSTQNIAYTGGKVVSPPVSSLGALYDGAGSLAFDANYIYFCVANYDSENPTANIWKRVAWSNDTW